MLGSLRLMRRRLQGLGASSSPVQNWSQVNGLKDSGKALQQCGCQLLTSTPGLVPVAGLAGPLPNILALDNLAQMMPGCLHYQAPAKLIFATLSLSLCHRSPAGFLLSKTQEKLRTKVLSLPQQTSLRVKGSSSIWF